MCTVATQMRLPPSTALSERTGRSSTQQNVASIASRIKRKKFLTAIELENEHSVEVLSFLVPTLYLVFISIKGTISLLDGVILVAIYGGVVYLLSLAPPEEAEKIDDMDAIPRWILRRRPMLRGNPHCVYMSITQSAPARSACAICCPTKRTSFCVAGYK